MLITQAAQPALLYIVPAVLSAVGIHSLCAGEAKALWTWSEEVLAEEEVVPKDSVLADVKQVDAVETRKDR